MATVVLNPDAQKFPAGATVKAYKRTNFPAVWDRTGAPQGTQDASATVATDGSVTFTGLTDGTEYLLYAATPDRYASFSTPALTGGDTAAQAKLDTLHTDLGHLTDGTLQQKGAPLTSETLANVASSATVVTLQASNAARRAWKCFNDSTSALYIKHGAAASLTSFTVKVPAGGYYEMPAPVYTGAITGIWDTANGNARVTEGA